MSATSEAENTPGKPNGENFNDEMKDYAKSTMNELLGMFGYEEAITREAVEELQIRLLPEEDENTQRASDALDKPNETDKDTPVAINLNAGEVPVVVPLAGGENGGNPSVIPVPVANNGVIPVSAAQPGVPAVSSGASGSVKPGTALAPHFLAEPPNIKGVYCVVASLPMVNSSGKTNMTFKFWNCIMCSEYFVQKPEVVFRVEHPHLFGSHPDWLYQAAVCQKCHHSLKASKQDTSSASAPKEVTTETGDGNRPDGASLTGQLLITNSSSKASDANFESSNVVGSNVVVSSSAGVEAMLTSPTGDKEECKGEAEVLFDCYVCSKQVRNNDRQGKLRRSKFPTLFSSLPESVGITRVCFTCCERLTRQRDRFVSAGISEENRDYAAHIKIWTGQDITSKLSSSASKNSDSSTCFVCEKYIPGNVHQDVKTLDRSKFPSLFSLVPDQIVKLLICDACNRKMLKVKGRFDENNTVEEERDYWVYINSWRDQKGLEKHMYSN